MKVLAVSDKVLDTLYSSNVWSKFPDIELIIGCGDLPYYYLEFLVSSFDVPLVYVHGNHDAGPQFGSGRGQITRALGGQAIDSRTIKIENLLLAGLGGSMRYRPHAQYMFTESEMNRQVMRLIPHFVWNRQRYGRYLDVLVAHSPPYGIHDREDLPHTGFKVFLKIMEWFRPRFLLHGHIHIYRQDTIRETQYQNTEVINVYPYRILEIPEFTNSP